MSQQAPVIQKPDPQIAIMLAAMASAAYVPYLDHEYSGPKKKPEEIAKDFENQLVLKALGKPKQNRNPMKYLYGTYDFLLENFRIKKMLISNVAVFYGTSSTCAGLVATREVQKQLEILIAFRGTQSISELLIDLKAVIKTGQTDDITGEYIKVHRGFNSIFQSVNDQIQNAINGAAKKFSKDKIKIYITGHSLGAALSVLCANHCMKKGYSVDVYNFGCPRVGNSEFKKSFMKSLDTTKSSSFRFYRATDNVPYLPPKKLGYEHVDIGYPLKEEVKKNGFIAKIGSTIGPYTNPAYGHSIDRDRESIYNAFYKKALTAWTQQNKELILKGLSDELSYEASTAFSRLGSGFEPTFANEPVLINGQKIIFDKAVTTTPITLEPKPERRQIYPNGNDRRPY